jgi:hypothetical protein
MPTMEPDLAQPPPAPKFHVSSASPALIERARQLYAAYTANAHNLNYQGKPCPPWDELGESVQSHWCATALSDAPSSICARFQVYSITSYGMPVYATADRLQADVVLRPGDSTKNVEWSRYTPNGEIRMTVTAPDTIHWFMENLGKEVDVLLGPKGALPGHPEFAKIS